MSQSRWRKEVANALSAWPHTAAMRAAEVPTSAALRSGDASGKILSDDTDFSFLPQSRFRCNRR